MLSNASLPGFEVLFLVRAEKATFRKRKRRFPIAFQMRKGGYLKAVDLVLPLLFKADFLCFRMLAFLFSRCCHQTKKESNFPKAEGRLSGHCLLGAEV